MLNGLLSLPAEAGEVFRSLEAPFAFRDDSEHRKLQGAHAMNLNGRLEFSKCVLGVAGGECGLLGEALQLRLN
jgi:hypothetical protein